MAFTTTTESDWQPHRGLLDEDGMLEMAMGGFLVRAGDRVVLVDLGIGESPVPFMTGGEFIDNLASHGVKPADVTDVILTHLHFDHIGWASRDGSAVFPNATYRCDVLDWEYFVDPPAAVTGQPVDDANLLSALVAPGSGRTLLEPVSDRVEMWDESCGLLPGIDVRLAPGHTPGSGVLVLSSGKERALLLGDVAHCPVELLDDEWGSIGDVDPALAKRTRVALMREYEAQDVLMAASHFRGVRFGHVRPAEGTGRWVV